MILYAKFIYKLIDNAKQKIHYDQKDDRFQTDANFRKKSKGKHSKSKKQSLNRKSKQEVRTKRHGSNYKLYVTHATKKHESNDRKSRNEEVSV